MAKNKEDSGRRRGQWTEEQLSAALLAIQRDKISQREVARRFKIQRRTLRNHIMSGSFTKKLGRKSTLPTELEKDLIKRIIRYADVGLPLTSSTLRHQAYKFCKAHNITTQFTDETEMAGRKWLKLFLERHPELAKRKTQMMNPAREEKLNKDIVKDHFEKIKLILENLQIKENPGKIYNIYEKGCKITLHHQQSVLAQKGAKRIHVISKEHSENVKIVGCVNAVGDIIPPMIIFKGKLMKSKFTDDLPPGTLVKMSEKGLMTCNLFLEIIKHLGKYKGSGQCLLIFDGASWHLDYSVVETAEKYGITLYCLPSNTAHELQPLHKSMHRSFEHHWDQELLKYLDQNPERSLDKTSFNKMFSKVWSKCMTHENIVNGFRAVGLYPFDPEAIPETALAPSTLTELLEPEESDPEYNTPLSVLHEKIKKEKND